MSKIKLLFVALILSATQISWAINPIVINQNSVGPITKNTPYDLKTLQRLLPNFEVKKSKSMSEGNSYDTIVAYSNNKPQFTIVPKERNNKKTIYLISSKSNLLKDSIGTAIGATFSSVYAASKTPQCIPAQEEMSGLEMCASPHAKNIVYVFAKNKTWNGPDNTVPPLNVLKDWKLKEVIWMANDKHTFKNGQYPRV
jgi:hypothetical protein